jgi:hypothetical protein
VRIFKECVSDFDVERCCACVSGTPQLAQVAAEYGQGSAWKIKSWAQPNGIGVVDRRTGHYIDIQAKRQCVGRKRAACLLESIIQFSQ